MTDSAQRRVLVLDDTPVTRLAVVESLLDSGSTYIVDSARSVDQALERVQQTTYVLALVDSHILGDYGHDFVEALRQPAPGLLVVLMDEDESAALPDRATRCGADGYVFKPFTMDHMREIVERAAEYTDEPHAQPSPTRPRLTERRAREGERVGQASLPSAELPGHKLLEDLVVDTGAHCVLLTSSSGYPIDVAGQTSNLHLPTLGALIAATFAAAAELSRQLGNVSDFRASHHGGPDSSIYTYEVMPDLLLAVVFGAQTKCGAVWLFAKRTAAALAALGPRPTPTAYLQADEDLTPAFDSELSQLFGDAGEQPMQADTASAAP
jgi:DNA-binding NarL/FixJ family response regulator/predicted regulator of Ras-like GTPase activity (Roadblock/LC7/MglB family)